MAPIVLMNESYNALFFAGIAEQAISVTVAIHLCHLPDQPPPMLLGIASPSASYSGLSFGYGGCFPIATPYTVTDDQASFSGHPLDDDKQEVSPPRTFFDVSKEATSCSCLIYRRHSVFALTTDIRQGRVMGKHVTDSVADEHEELSTSLSVHCLIIIRIFEAAVNHSHVLSRMIF